MSKFRLRMISVFLAGLLLAIFSVFAGAQESFEGTTIRVFSIDNPNLKTVLSFAPEVEKLTGMKVLIDHMPYRIGMNKVSMEFAAGMSSYDVINVDSPHQAVWGDPGHLEPLEDYIKKDPGSVALDDFFPLSLYYLGWYDYWNGKEGRLLGLPGVGNYGMLFYRKDLFENPAYQAEFQSRYGYSLKPPQSLSQFRDMAKFFTRDTNGDGKIDIWGALNRYGGPMQILCDTLSMVFSYGGGLIDENFQPRLTDKSTLEAWKWFTDLYLVDKVYPPGAFAYIQDDVMGAFMEGRAAMMFSETWAPPFLLDPGFSKYADKTGVTIAPGYEYTSGKIRRGTFLGGGSWAITSYSKNKDAAWALIKYLTGKDIANRVCDRSNGAIADRWSVVKDPVLRTKYPWLEGVEQGADAIRGRPVFPLSIEMCDLAGGALQEYVKLGGKVSLETVMAGTESEIKEMIERAGYIEEGRKLISPDEIKSKLIPELLEKCGY